MKKLMLLALLLFAFSSSAFSEVKPVETAKKAGYYSGPVQVLVHYFYAKSGNPIAGATVTLNGSAYSVTDINGECMVMAYPGDLVGISDIGYVNDVLVPETDIIFPGTFPKDEDEEN